MGNDKFWMGNYCITQWPGSSLRFTIAAIQKNIEKLIETALVVSNPANNFIPLRLRVIGLYFGK